MESVTINLEGLREFGPFGYIAAYAMVGMFFGVLGWRQLAHAGTCFGDACSDETTPTKTEKQADMKGGFYVFRAVFALTISLFCLLMSNCMTFQQYDFTYGPGSAQVDIGEQNGTNDN